MDQAGIPTGTSRLQADICRRFQVAPTPASPALNSGVSRSMIDRSGDAPGSAVDWPVYAVRHHTESNTTGWYLWTGKHSQADDFYLPWHTQHLYEQWPEITPYLALPPGWGFVIAPDYEDVWFDPDLLV